MEAKDFLEYTQECISRGEIEKAISKFKGQYDDIRHTSESCTMFLVFAIYEREQQLGETSFVQGCSNVEDVMERYDQLKFYLRRYDFDVCYDTTEFVDFIKENGISSSAILYVVKTSIVDRVKVMNEVSMTLLESGESLTALRIMTFLYGQSKDDVTLFNLSKIMYEMGEYDTAKMIVEEISAVTSQVETLKSMILEKLL